MPGKRRYAPYSRTGRGRGGSTAYKAAAAYAAVRKMKRRSNTEYKQSNAGTSAAISSTGSITVVNHAAQGDDHTERTGRSIRCMDFYMRLTAASHASATHTFVRSIVFRDKSGNGSVPAVGDVLNTADHLSMLNTNFGKRFTVIADETISIEGSAAGGGDVAKFYKVYRNLRGDTHVEFNTGTAGTGADINTGAMYHLLISDQATNTPTVDWISRVKYIDN